MNREDKIIVDRKSVVEILRNCSNNSVVFEATDEQENLFSLGLEEIVSKTSTDAKIIFQNGTDQIRAAFRLLQKGAAEMRVNCNYVFSFQYVGAICAFNGRLLAAAPDSCVLTYALEDKIYRHPIRRSHRLSIDSLDRVFVEIGNKAYRLINLSLGGVGIIISEPDIFEIGQGLPVKLLYGNKILEATGSVRHVGPLAGGGFICGISLTYPNKKCINLIRKFIHQTHQNHSNLLKMNLILR